MAFMGNNFNRFARDVMRMEVASSDMKLREADREQSAKDHGSRIAAHLAMLIGVLLLLFMVLRPLFGDSTEQEKKDFFYQFTAEQMAARRTEYYLYDQLSTLETLSFEDGWMVCSKNTDDPSEAAVNLIGSGYLVRSWTDLVEAECERLWGEWYYGTEDISSDNYIQREIERLIDDKALIGLTDSSWLVIDNRDFTYILVNHNGTWALKSLEDFK
ncbi:MAG: hypothetical protein J6D61_01000 [Clostridia bacterium]|nr:hypothetical protein [Clostridia bacterium]